MGKLNFMLISTILCSVSFSRGESISSHPEDKIVYLNPKSENLPVPQRVDQEAGARIVGGEEAKANEFPSLVYLLIEIQESETNRTIYEDCLGSIINSTWILTTAHCLNPTFGLIQNIWVTAGDHNRSLVEGSEQTRSVKRYIVNAYYNPETFLVDIGLVEVSQAFVLNEFVEIASVADSTYITYEGTPTVVAGWGRSAPSGPRSDVLLKANVSTTNQQDCQSKYSSSGYWIYDKICAQAPEVGACTGDEGGPLYCSSQDELFICGIMSISMEYHCGSFLFPSAYTIISLRVDWIKGYVPNVKTAGYTEPASTTPTSSQESSTGDGSSGPSSTVSDGVTSDVTPTTTTQSSGAHVNNNGFANGIFTCVMLTVLKVLNEF